MLETRSSMHCPDFDVFARAESHVSVDTKLALLAFERYDGSTAG